MYFVVFKLMLMTFELLKKNTSLSKYKIQLNEVF